MISKHLSARFKMYISYLLVYISHTNNQCVNMQEFTFTYSNIYVYSDDTLFI